MRQKLVIYPTMAMGCANNLHFFPTVKKNGIESGLIADRKLQRIDIASHYSERGCVDHRIEISAGGTFATHRNCTNAKGKNICDWGDGYGNSSMFHGQANLFMSRLVSRDFWVFIYIVPALEDDKHIIDTDA